MGNELFALIPKGAAQIVLVLIRSFPIGIEREEEQDISGEYPFGGVPRLPLLGYTLCDLTTGSWRLYSKPPSGV